MVLMFAAFGLGFILGPVLGGVFSDYGSRAPFVAAAVLSLLNWLYGFFILPETLKKENRRAFDIKRANPLGALIQLKRSKHIRTLIIGMFMIYLAGQAMPAIWPFYTKFMYHCTDRQIGYSLGFVGIMVSIVQGGLIKFTQKKFGNQKAIYLGLAMYFIGLVLFAFANQPWMMYAFTFIYALGGIAPPAIQGIISGRVANNEQGELQGMVTALNSLSNILSPLLMTLYFINLQNQMLSYIFLERPLLQLRCLF